MARPPTILEYLHAPRGTYPTVDAPDRTWGLPKLPQTMQVPYRAPVDANDTEAWMRQQPIGPGGVVTETAPWRGPNAPHVGMLEALAQPLATPDEAPAPFAGLLPGNNPGGVHNDAGVGVADARLPVRNRIDAINAENPLRIPRLVRPGRASQASQDEVGGPERVLGRALMALLGVR